MEAVSALTRDQHWDHRNYIFRGALAVSVDFVIATGGQMPSYENLQALHENGYLESPPEVILAVAECASMDEFHGLVQTWYEDRLEERQQKEESLLSQIEEAREKGLVPDIIFREIVYSTSKEHLKRVKSNGQRPRYDTAALTESEVADEEKLVRYAKFLVASSLLDAPAGWQTETHTSRKHEGTERRKINVALGVNPATGKMVPSFTGALASTRGSITPGAVQLEALRQDLYDYVYPGLEQQRLRNIVKASGIGALKLLEADEADD